MPEDAESQRLKEHRARKTNWRHWGPYLSERSWGTVREDYSSDGEAWNFFPHDHARSRAYRWNEDGIGGLSDRFQYLCFAPTFWNGNDPILKERFFGLNPWEGNHGEDVKEVYFYLDATPTHSYMQMLYKYPQEAFPYQQLVRENQKRGSNQPEYELWETGIFNLQKYFDLTINYAKADSADILITISAVNRGNESAPLHILPTLWFRNTWSWGYAKGPMEDVPDKPTIALVKEVDVPFAQAHHPAAGTYYLYVEEDVPWFFTENETNVERLYGQPNATPYVKDAFHRCLIEGKEDATNPRQQGTKAAPYFQRILAPKETWTLRLRLSSKVIDRPYEDFEAYFKQRKKEADEFYAVKLNALLNDDQKRCNGKPLPICFGASNSITMTWSNGSRATNSFPPSRESCHVIKIGFILSILMSSPCLIGGRHG